MPEGVKIERSSPPLSFKTSVKVPMAAADKNPKKPLRNDAELVSDLARDYAATDRRGKKAASRRI